jgi:5'-methylthioadenosine phosphorylase
MRIGVIGGSGLYDLEGMKDLEPREVSTPFGSPSDEYLCGSLKDVEVCFLPRHGRGHRLLPSEINHRANIFGFKTLGVERIVSVSAVGSLKEELRPRDIVLPDQYYDRTKASAEHTFFGNGIVAHISFAEPTCPDLRDIVGAVAREVIAGQPGLESRVNVGGTYVNMEGPAFSTKAESNVYRELGFDVIGMTGLAEAKLAREAELCYQPMSMVTDYDCWHESEEAVTVEMVIAHLTANSRLARDILRALIPRIPGERRCECGQALESAILTDAKAIPENVKKTLAPVVGKYV